MPDRKLKIGEKYLFVYPKQSFVDGYTQHAGQVLTVIDYNFTSQLWVAIAEDGWIGRFYPWEMLDMPKEREQKHIKKFLNRSSNNLYFFKSKELENV